MRYEFAEFTWWAGGSKVHLELLKEISEDGWNIVSTHWSNSPIYSQTLTIWCQKPVKEDKGLI